LSLLGRRRDHAAHDLREITVTQDFLKGGAVFAPIIITACAGAGEYEHQ
jgi:hypothetical protein